MIPSVIVIVEDKEERIKHLLAVIAVSNNQLLCLKIKEEASNLLKRDNNNYCIEHNGSSIKIINPAANKDLDFTGILNLLTDCIGEPAICFLDFELGNHILDTIAVDEFVTNGYTIAKTLAAGLKIGKLFNKKFGRLLVQSSTEAPTLGFEPDKYGDFNLDFFAPGANAARLEGALLLLNKTLEEYKIRYQLWGLKTDFLNKANITEKLNRFFHIVCTKYDKMTHEELQAPDSYKELKALTNIQNCYKAFFELDRKTPDWVDVKIAQIKEALVFLEIESATFPETLIVEDKFRFPAVPGFPFLISLKIFLILCVDAGNGLEAPALSFSFNKDDKKVYALLDFNNACKGLITEHAVYGEESARHALDALKRGKVIGINPRCQLFEGLKHYNLSKTARELISVKVGSSNSQLILSWPI